MTAIAALPLLASNGDDWGHGWWPIWPLLWVALIGTAVWFIVRRRDRRHDGAHPAEDDLEVGRRGARQSRERPEALGVRLEQNRGPAREVRIECPVLGEQAGQTCLEFGQRHSFLAVSQASRPPCLRSCSATHATSDAPMR